MNNEIDIKVQKSMKKTKFRKALGYTVVGLAFTSVLAGCSDFKAAKQFDNQTMTTMNNMKPPVSKPVVQNTNLPYLGTSIVHTVNQLPDSFKHDTVTVMSHSLKSVAGRITESSGIPVYVDNTQSGSTSLPGLPGQGKVNVGSSSNSGNSDYISVDYKGTVSGLLKYLQSKYGVWAKPYNGGVLLYTHETKTFQLIVPDSPVAEKMDITSSTGGPLGNTSSTGSGGGSSGSSSAAGQGKTSIKTSMGSDIWGGIQDTVKALAGKSAQVAVDPALHTITVYGTPPQIARVSNWVNDLNKRMSSQVEISVHVYSVTLNHEQNYSFNPAVAFNQVANHYGFSLSGITGPAVIGSATPFKLGTFVQSSAGGSFGGSTAAVKALATIGNVTQTFEQNVITLNNQPVPIQVAKNTGYAAESQVSTTANVGSSSSLIPGNISTGFTGYFSPSIVNGRIMLNMMINLSNLDGINQYSSNGSTINVPNSSASKFSQVVLLHPGQTMMLTGYKQKQDQTTHNGVGSPFFNLLGGGADAANNNHMIAITVTARIINQ